MNDLINKAVQIMMSDGKAERVVVDEANHPQLSKINELIERRIEQIKEFCIKNSN